MVQDMLALTDGPQIFEQIPLVAVGKMRGVDWTIITVSFPCHLLPTLHCTTRQCLSQLKMLVPYGLLAGGQKSCTCETSASVPGVRRLS